MSPSPHSALNAHLSPIGVFMDAPSVQKLIMIVLMIAIPAVVAVLAVKFSSGRRLSGGSAFVSGLRLGAPILGLLGACDAGLNMTLAVASIPIEPTLKMLAPGIAETFLMVGMGFFVGAVAVVAHWAVESRIDRQVLSV